MINFPAEFTGVELTSTTNAIYATLDVEDGLGTDDPNYTANPDGSITGPANPINGSTYRIMVIKASEGFTQYITEIVVSSSSDAQPFLDFIKAKGAGHYWTLDNTVDDSGEWPVNMPITSGNYSFVESPVCEGFTHALQSTNANNTTTRTDGALVANKSNGGINYGASTSNNPPWTTSSYAVSFWFEADANDSPTCIYEQGGGTNNVAFVLGIGGTITVQGADKTSNSIFLIAKSKFQAVPGRKYHVTGVWLHSSQTGEYNRFYLYVNGVLQEIATSSGATSGFSEHPGDIAIGNTAESLQTYNNSTLPFATRTKRINALSIVPEVVLDETSRLALVNEEYDRSVIATHEILPDTVANQQSAFDALSNLNFEDTNCAVRIFQATDATDYTLYNPSITFEEDEALKNTAIQFVGTGNLTIVNTNGGNAKEVSSSPGLRKANGNVYVGGGGITVSSETALRLLVRQDLTDFTADTVILEEPGEHTLTNGIGLTKVVNKSGGEVQLNIDKAVTVVNEGTSTTTVFDSFLSFAGLIGSWRLYATEEDAERFDNELANGTISDIYRFGYSGIQTFYYRTSGVLGTVTVYAAGETEVDVSLQGQNELLRKLMEENTILLERLTRARVL